MIKTSCPHLVFYMQLILTLTSHVNYVLRFYFYKRQEILGKWSGICLIGEVCQFGEVSVGYMAVGSKSVGNLSGRGVVHRECVPRGSVRRENVRRGCVQESSSTRAEKLHYSFWKP